MRGATPPRLTARTCRGQLPLHFSANRYTSSLRRQAAEHPRLNSDARRLLARGYTVHTCARDEPRLR